MRIPPRNGTGRFDIVPLPRKAGPPRSVRGGVFLRGRTVAWHSKGRLPGLPPSDAGLVGADAVGRAEGGEREIGLQRVEGGLGLLVDVVDGGVALAGEGAGNPR